MAMAETDRWEKRRSCEAAAQLALDGIIVC
jgi:hypothetical protein